MQAKYLLAQPMGLSLKLQINVTGRPALLATSLASGSSLGRGIANFFATSSRARATLGLWALAHGRP